MSVPFKTHGSELASYLFIDETSNSYLFTIKYAAFSFFFFFKFYALIINVC